MIFVGRARATLAYLARAKRVSAGHFGEMPSPAEVAEAAFDFIAPRRRSS